jgi:hypothetical protein
MLVRQAFGIYKQNILHSIRLSFGKNFNLNRIDGVGLYKASMASSANNWQYDAFKADPGLDACNGHADLMKIYHNHANPSCITGNNQISMTTHSPIVGYLFDGEVFYNDKILFNIKFHNSLISF